MTIAATTPGPVVVPKAHLMIEAIHRACLFNATIHPERTVVEKIDKNMVTAQFFSRDCHQMMTIRVVAKDKTFQNFARLALEKLISPGKDHCLYGCNISQSYQDTNAQGLKVSWWIIERNYLPLAKDHATAVFAAIRSEINAQ